MKNCPTFLCHLEKARIKNNHFWLDWKWVSIESNKNLLNETSRILLVLIWQKHLHYIQQIKQATVSKKPDSWIKISFSNMFFGEEWTADVMKHFCFWFTFPSCSLKLVFTNVIFYVKQGREDKLNAITCRHEKSLWKWNKPNAHSCWKTTKMIKKVVTQIVNL